jgi:hypothetical protein
MKYWQGIGNTSPLAGMWEVAVDTAEGISDGLSCLTKTTKSLPLIHFGSITLHQQVGFVAGGTSRVYFGKWGRKEVALKILFAMELTPDVVAEFYNEVQILNTLQHRNVVTCLGISVMPPSISLVMEHCSYGSLFDHLYKVRKQAKRTQSTADSVAGTTTKLYSIINEFRTRLSSYTSSKSSGIANGNQSAKTSMCVVKSPLSGRISDAGTDSGTDKDRNSLYVSNRDSIDDFNDIESYLESTARPSMTTRQSLNGRSSAGSAHSGKDMNRESFRQSLNVGRKHRGLSMNQRMKEKLTVRNLASHTASTTTKKPINTIAPYNTGGSSSSVNNSAHVGTSQLPSFSFPEKLRMMHDVVAGILFLHEEGYIHCDIKSPNFLVANVS